MNNLDTELSIKDRWSDVVDMMEDSRRLADVLVDSGLLTRKNADRILQFQEVQRSRWETIYFWEIVFSNGLVAPKEFLSVVLNKWISLHPTELFMAHGIVTKDMRNQAKKIQQEYGNGWTMKELKDIYMEDFGEAMREKCMEVLTLSLTASISAAKESRREPEIENRIFDPVVSQREDTSSRTWGILDVPSKPRLGESLVKAHFISQQDLDKALEYQAEKKAEGKVMLIGEIVMLLGFVDKPKFLNFVKTHGFSMRTGELLIAYGLIDGNQLEKAMVLQKELEKTWVTKQIGDIFVEDMGVLSRERLLKIVAQQKNMIRVKPNISELDTKLIFLFWKERMKKMNFLPYKAFKKYDDEKEWGKGKDLTGYVITVLSDDCMGERIDGIKTEILKKSSDIKLALATNAWGKKEVVPNLTLEVVFEYATKEELSPFIDECFLNERTLKSAGHATMIWKQEYTEGNSDVFNLWRGFYSESNDNINIFADILMRALDLWASDVHIEPTKDKIKVRARIDGALQTIMELPVQIKRSFTNSIKLYFRFKDGHIRGKVVDSRKSVFYHDQNYEVDLRFSVVPTVHGEKIVARLLVQKETVPTIQELWMQRNLVRKYELICGMSNGIVIVTGPTWSGKTTTLQATLLGLHNDERNITTIEDPPEYLIKGVNQIDAGWKHGLTFNEVVKGILRQDPDILMFGEMRDLESAQNALTAGLTGRLLFTTLHTNDSISAITRLIDMGIKPFLLGSTLVSIAGQRLVRKICPDCKIEYTPDPKDMHYFRRYLKDMDSYLEKNNVKFYRGKGCDCCRHTGYKWRLSIVELFCVNEELKISVLEGKTVSQLEAIARRYGMTSMTEDGFSRIISGETTVEEVLRVVKTLQFPKQKRTVEEIQYLLNGPMTQQEVEDAIYGTTAFETPDINQQIVNVLKEDTKILQEGVLVETGLSENQKLLLDLVQKQQQFNETLLKIIRGA